MDIEFKCPCGAACRAEEAKAGQLFRCEACGLDIPVPAAPGGAPSAAAEPAPGAPPTARPSAMEALRAEVGKPGAAADLVSQIRAAKAAGAGQAPPAAGEHLAEKAAADIIPTAEVVGESAAAPGKSAMEALQADIGHKGDVNEMLAQLGGAKPGTGPGAAPGAGLAAVAALAARPARPTGLPKPPTGVARAAHHFKFKRVMWIPALVVAGLCVVLGVVLGVWSLLPRSAPEPPDVDKIKEPEIVTDATGEMWAIPRGTQAVARSDGLMGYRDEAGQEGAAKQVITDEAGRFWAVPAGKTIQVSKTGKMFYEDDTGYEVMAEPADDWVDIYKQLEKIRTYHGGRQHGNLWFGGALLAVGLVLAALGLWMWIDVRTVRREAAEKVGQALAAAASGPALLGAPVAASAAVPVAAPPGASPPAPPDAPEAASAVAPPGASPPVPPDAPEAAPAPAPPDAPEAASAAAPPDAPAAVPPATEKPPGPQPAPGEPPANTTALD
ncbi:MAG: hypothetical protein IMZ44_10870 [Planctomycetes bacterium]|nr:hypothetical protein [Planctomycetota bacterium]